MESHNCLPLHLPTGLPVLQCFLVIVLKCLLVLVENYKRYFVYMESDMTISLDLDANLILMVTFSLSLSLSLSTCPSHTSVLIIKAFWLSYGLVFSSFDLGSLWSTLITGPIKGRARKVVTTTILKAFSRSSLILCIQTDLHMYIHFGRVRGVRERGISPL